MQQKYTTQESIAPYYKAVVSDGSSVVAECRAVHMKGASAEVDLTMNGAVVSVFLIQGHTYPYACTLADSNKVVHLY